jgi:hypothetical protein
MSSIARKSHSRKPSSGMWMVMMEPWVTALTGALPGRRREGRGRQVRVEVRAGDYRTTMDVLLNVLSSEHHTIPPTNIEHRRHSHHIKSSQHHHRITTSSPPRTPPTCTCTRR